ncbi:MAG TPA: hypothetical protein VJS13_13235 [Pyrinomonadaceae bacterium]|nr:hypothetical protein [Pyrinomonadaceae bacterium]
MSAPELQTKPTGPVSRESYPLIDYVFDRAVHIVRRIKELVWELKELAIALLILYLLIRHAAHLF